jgi:hypothetical protein
MIKKARRATKSVVEMRANATDYILDMGECSDRLNVCLRTFQRVIERGEGPPVVMITRWRQGVLQSDFTAWLKSRRVGPEIAQMGRPRGRPRKQPPPTEPPTAAAE